ncbi:unannotated protein [freshwater metagenome]|uniref:Unannotated protein n=1 Tax=freshwater metagenome TaxID=449393 RepID=A0A6J7IUR0_9ZZZZ
MIPPTTTAVSAMIAPVRMTARRPRSGSAASQLAERSTRIARCMRMKNRAVTANANVDARRSCSAASSEQKMNTTAPGASASNGDQMRNAAQSARNPTSHMATHAPRTKPGWATTGVRISRKSCHASSRSTRAASRVASVGRSRRVVEEYRTRPVVSASPTNEARADSRMPRPRRRIAMATACEIAANAARRQKNEWLTKMRLNP